MSAPPRNSQSLGYAGLRMSALDYLALAETEERYQLMDGVVILSPSPTPRHQIIAQLVASAIQSSIEHLSGARVIPDIDLQLGQSRVYAPDIVVYGAGRLAQIPTHLSTPPDLVIEILSRGSKALDLITKRDDYERFGVGEYWAVDPDPVNARIWRRSGAQLLEQGVQSEIVECHSIPGVRVDLSRVRSAVGLA